MPRDATPPLIIVRASEVGKAQTTTEVDAAANTARRVARESGEAVHVYVLLETFAPPPSPPALPGCEL